MARYKLFIKPSAVKEIEAVVRKKDRQRMITRIRELKKNPRPPGCEKLSGIDKYRLRQGPYRIIYLIQDEEFSVTVVKVGHRKEVYRWASQPAAQAAERKKHISNSRKIIARSLPATLGCWNILLNKQNRGQRWKKK